MALALNIPRTRSKIGVVTWNNNLVLMSCLVRYLYCSYSGPDLTLISSKYECQLERSLLFLPSFLVLFEKKNEIKSTHYNKFNHLNIIVFKWRCCFRQKWKREKKGSAINIYDYVFSVLCVYLSDVNIQQKMSNLDFHCVSFHFICENWFSLYFI